MFCVGGLVCRVAQPSDFVPLSDGAFMPAFEALWAQHIEFGTNRSHKKLFGKRRDDRPSAEAVGGADGSASACSKAPRRAAEAGAAAPTGLATNHALLEMEPTGAQRAATGAAERPQKNKPGRSKDGPAAATQAAAAQPLASKGRFAGTLAARLLGGGS